MASNVGDELVLNIEDNFGYRDKTVRQIKVQIINVSYDEYDSSPMYLCYVPSYLTHPGSFKISELTCKKFKLAKKWLGEQAVMVQHVASIARRIEAPRGEQCSRCKDFVVGATKSEDEFRCRACKENPWR